MFTEPFLPCGTPDAWNSSESGHPYAFQDDDGRLYLFYQGSDSLIAPKVYSDPEVSDSIQSVQTDYYTAEIAEDGSFDKITLKQSREVITGQANKLRVFIDTGDAWDFEDYYRDQSERYLRKFQLDTDLGDA